MDYRKLNDAAVEDAVPIPKINQTFDALNGQKYLSSLDLASGYWQVPVAKEDRHKTAFVTPIWRILRVCNDALRAVQRPWEVPATHE